MKNCKCMCNFTEEVKKSSTAVWLLAFCSFLIGVIVGKASADCCKCSKSCCKKSSESKCGKYIEDDDDDEIKF